MLSEVWVETLEVEVLMPLPLKPMVCPWKCRIALRLVQLVEPWWLLPPLMPLPLNPMVDVPMVRVWLPCWLLWARGVSDSDSLCGSCISHIMQPSCGCTAKRLQRLHTPRSRWKTSKEGNATKSSESLNHEHP